MKDLLRKYHKYLVIFGIALLLMIFGSLYMVVRYSLPQTVRTILLEFTGADIESESINFTRKGLIEVRDATLKDGKELILEAPLIEIKYSTSNLIRGRIDEIKVVNPNVWLTRNANNDINIVDVFLGSEDDESETSDTSEDTEEYVNEGSSVPIDKITVEDGYLYYKDTAYEVPIEKEASSVNGYVSFDKKDGIYLSFNGESTGIRGEEKLGFSLSTKDHPYDLGIKLESVSINDNLMQYAYKDNDIVYYDGVVNLDMTLNPGGFGGRADFNELEVSYRTLDAPITQGSGDVNFAGEKIYVRGDFLMGDHPGKLFIEYKGEAGVDIDFYLKDIEYGKLAAYEELAELALPINDLIFDNVHVNLAFDEKNDLKVNIDFSSSYYKAGEFAMEDFSGRLYYEGGDNFYLKDVKLKGEYPNKYLPLDFFMEVDARLTEDDGDLTYKVYDIESGTNIEAVSGSAELDFIRKIFSLKMDSDILDLDVKFDLEKDLFTLKQSSKKGIEVEIKDQKITNRSDLNFIYDLKEKSFLLGRGEIDISYEGGSLLGNISTLEDNIKFENFKYYDETGSLSGRGEVNLKDLSYEVDFKSENLEISRFLEVEGLKLIGNIGGKIKGIRDQFEGNIEVEDLSGEYFLKFNNLEGDIYVKNDGVFNSYFNGYLGELEYEGFSFYDFQVSADINNNILRVRDFGNNISNIYGSYDLAEDQLDFKYHITDVRGRKLEVSDMTLDIESVSGVVLGSSEDVRVISDIDGVVLTLPIQVQEDSIKSLTSSEEGKQLFISGRVEYGENNISLERLKVNESIVSGNYSLDTGMYSFKANLLEDDIPSYYGDINLKYRILGEVYLWGNREITKVYTRTSLDKVYLRGQQLPDLYIEGSFMGGTPETLLETGRLDLKKVVLLGDNREELVEAEARVDFKEKSILVRNKNKTIDISKFSYLNPDLVLEGMIDLDFEIDGDLQDLKYFGDVSSSKFKVGDIELNNLEISLEGDLDSAELEEFSVDYEGNNLSAEGAVDLKKLEYFLNVKSSEIDLEFLNVFLYPLGVEDIKGLSKIDLTLKNERNTGSFVVDGLSAKIPEYGIDIEDVNSDIKLNNDKIFIDEFTGIVNEGTLSLDGYLEIPDLKRMKNELDPISLLNYSLNLRAERVKYNYEDVIELTLSTNATLKDNKITGEFVVNRGEVIGIPEVSDKEIEEIKDKTSEAGENAIAASIDLGKDFAIKTRGSSSMEIDIDLLIEEGIFINLEKVAPLVEDLEAVIKGKGRVTVKDSRIRFLGELNSENGVVTINNNLFELDRVVLLFSDPDEYFPDVNPTVTLNARSVIANEEVYILVTGKGEDLEIILSSASGLSQEDIASLLAFHNTLDSSSSNVVVKNILDSQISRQLFNPVSGEIQRMLRLSKFRISSDITAYEYQDGEYEESSLGLGASVEAENPIYKNKVYWNASARIADNKTGDSVDEYDFIVEHRFAPSLSWGVGVGKLPEGRIKTSEGETSNLNYHIDFKFRKRYNSITEIFIRK